MALACVRTWKPQAKRGAHGSTCPAIFWHVWRQKMHKQTWLDKAPAQAPLCGAGAGLQSKRARALAGCREALCGASLECCINNTRSYTVTVEPPEPDLRAHVANARGLTRDNATGKELCVTRDPSPVLI